MDPTVTGELTAAPASDDPGAFADSLPDELGETDPSIRKAIKGLVKRLGEPLCAEMLQRTCEIEEGGGLWLVRERRRRTKGGVFLVLLKGHSAKARALVRRIGPRPEAQQAKRSGPEGQQPTREPFLWEQRGELVQEALRHRGKAMTAKMTLIGRPGKVVEHGDFVVTSMESTSIPPLPKGVPVPSSPRVTYTVFIAAKQWQKVAGPLKVPDDMLIVEGFCVPDAEAGGISLLALSSTTKALQRQKLTLAKAPRAEPASPGLGTTPQARAPEAPPKAPAIPAATPAPAPVPSEEEQARALLQKVILGGETFEALALRTGLPLNRLKEIHEGRPTTLSPAQVRTFFQRLRQVLR
jgi:hypothetical protein